jgi:Na+(H+)/acetate symporter ActP
LTSVGAVCGLAVGGVTSGVATTLAVTGVVDEHLLGGWPAVVVGYPAAVTVPLAFLTMVVVSRVTASTRPPDVARIFAQMHVPERLGMGVERVPRGG